MSVAKELVDYLAANGLGAFGTDLFVNTSLPSFPDACGGVTQTAGLAPSDGFSVQGIQDDMPGAQVIFRGARDDYEGPRIKANTAYTLLNKIQGQTLGTTKYLMVNAIQAPSILEGRDANGRATWFFNVRTERRIG